MINMYTIEKPSDPAFDAVYELYSKMFPLPEERVSKEAFIAGLAKNDDPAFQAKKEKGTWVYAKDEESGKIVGASYCVTYAGSKTPGFHGTVHGTYLFVDEAYRSGMGIFQKLVSSVQTIGEDYCRQVVPGAGEKPNVLVIGEQNQPLKMTARQYLEDAKQVDPCVRLTAFEFIGGFKSVRLPYIQPALAAGEEACNYLGVVAKTKSATIPSSVIEEHFSRFFARSFPSGTNFDMPELKEMRSALSAETLQLENTGRYARLSKELNVATISQLPASKMDMPLEQVMPELAARFEANNETKTNVIELKTNLKTKRGNMSKGKVDIANIDVSKLEVVIIDRPDHPDFDKVYKAYSKVFTLPSERESKENFKEYLAANGAPDKKEQWVCLKDPKSGEVIGASNNAVYAGNEAKGVDGSIHGIYMVVPEEYRLKGVFARLIEEREKAAADFISKGNGKTEMNLMTVCEQNSPLLMTPHEYLADNKAAGIDQCRRRDVFENPKAGFRTLDFRYIQPPLEQGGETCDYLDLIGKVSKVQKSGDTWKSQNLATASIPAAAITEHLTRFFDASFPEGTSLSTPGLEAMKASLDRQTDVALKPAGKFTAMSKIINVDTLNRLDEKTWDIPLGQTFARTMEHMDKKGNIRTHNVSGAAKVGEELGNAFEGGAKKAASWAEMATATKSNAAAQTKR